MYTKKSTQNTKKLQEAGRFALSEMIKNKDPVLGSEAFKCQGKISQLKEEISSLREKTNELKKDFENKVSAWESFVSGYEKDPEYKASLAQKNDHAKSLATAKENIKFTDNLWTSFLAHSPKSHQKRLFAELANQKISPWLSLVTWLTSFDRTKEKHRAMDKTRKIFLKKRKLMQKVLTKRLRD